MNSGSTRGRAASVREVAVIGRPDERWGQIPVAYITPAPGTSLSLPDLTAFLHGRLASFKLPKALVLLPALPRNAGGKVLKPTLRAADAEGVDGMGGVPRACGVDGACSG
ncbi:AMP-binding enzyme [Streptomyces shenzhenensis]|uniref:AMP-binding enzyme n=1 Tax=Streptomyces shenzhenensis TaxID=943815 RepID=UPI0015F0C18A|nr:hypothetical protein [Streptomyces shenzhenensis]